MCIFELLSNKILFSTVIILTNILSLNTKAESLGLRDVNMIPLSEVVDWNDGQCIAVPKPTNTSGDFVALGGTDGFVELPRGTVEFPAGYAARFFTW